MISLKEFQEKYPKSEYSYLQFCGNQIIRQDHHLWLRDSAEVKTLVFSHWLLEGKEVSFFMQHTGECALMCSSINMFNNWYLSATGSDIKLLKINSDGEIINMINVSDSFVLSAKEWAVLKRCCRQEYNDSYCMLLIRYILAKRFSSVTRKMIAYRREQIKKNIL